MSMNFDSYILIWACIFKYEHAYLNMSMHLRLLVKVIVEQFLGD